MYPSTPITLTRGLPPRLPVTQSGDPIGDDNPPLVLPNGRVYGSRAIRALARPAAGTTGAGTGDAATAAGGGGGGIVGFDGTVGGAVGASVVTCPSTGQTFRFDQLRSVYII